MKIIYMSSINKGEQSKASISNYTILLKYKYNIIQYPSMLTKNITLSITLLYIFNTYV